MPTYEPILGAGEDAAMASRQPSTLPRGRTRGRGAAHPCTLNSGEGINITTNTRSTSVKSNFNDDSDDDDGDGGVDDDDGMSTGFSTADAFSASSSSSSTFRRRHLLSGFPRRRCLGLTVVVVTIVYGLSRFFVLFNYLEPPPTVLISLDGFRPQFLELGITPNLLELAKTGLQAVHVLPVFPVRLSQYLATSSLIVSLIDTKTVI